MLLQMSGIETNPGPTCEFCGKQYIKNWILKRHIAKIHTKTVSTMCNECNIGFNSLEEWNNRMIIIHKPSRKIFKIINHAFKSRVIELACFYYDDDIATALGSVMEARTRKELLYL